ncbi:MAG: hypothetical protein PHU27_06035 [Salinivirgaceae bacterium]|nr:hypothetical protein [Salinivirgaceae bacterium]MDD4746571.1 hypothetical protein [Salinivirgaceae bacterium]MDY0279605.1 hypothetical protein [Salinivirgaceae bacterium]
MKNIKFKLIAVLVLIFGITVFISCIKEDTNFSYENDAIEMIDVQKNTLDPEYIGKMHNEYLDRIYKDFMPNYQPQVGELLDINELLEFLFEQPESKSITEEEKNSIRVFFLSFNTKGDGSQTFNQFSDYLENNVSEIYGASFENILSGNATRGITPELINVHNSIKTHSELYWGSKNNAKVCISCLDAAGGVWGFFFGGVGSFIGGAAASMIGELIVSCDGPAPVFDGVIHTPKDC